MASSLLGIFYSLQVHLSTWSNVHDRSIMKSHKESTTILRRIQIITLMIIFSCLCCPHWLPFRPAVSPPRADVRSTFFPSLWLVHTLPWTFLATALDLDRFEA